MHSGISFNKTEEEILKDGIIQREQITTKVTRDYDSTKHSIIFLDREWFSTGDLLDSGKGIILINSKFYRISEADTVYNVQLQTGNPEQFLQLNIGESLKFIGNTEENKSKITEQKQLHFELEDSGLQVYDITRPGYAITFDYDNFSQHKSNSVLVVSSDINLNIKDYIKEKVPKFDAIAHVTCEDHIRRLTGKRFDIVLLHPTGDFWLWSKCVNLFKCKIDTENQRPSPNPKPNIWGGNKLITSDKIPARKIKPQPLYLEEELVPSQFFGLDDYLKTK